MKTNLRLGLMAAILLLIPTLNFAQAPALGTAADFVLFSTDKAVKNENVLAKLTGNVGTNASSTGFGNVDGVMHDNDGTSATCITDLLLANASLTNASVTATHVVGLGGGEILTAGVYSMGTGAAATLSGLLILNGNSSDVFIFKIDGSFSTNVNSEIRLTGGASACNVFWQVNGVISMATGCIMKGTFIATNFAINMTGVELEGRALSIAGAITVDGITARIPISCGSPNISPKLNGPNTPTLASTECYVLFSTSGNVTNTVPTAIAKGDIGTNLGLTSGFTLANVNGTVHPSNDVSTGVCASDLGIVYNYLHTLTASVLLVHLIQNLLLEFYLNQF